MMAVSPLPPKHACLNFRHSCQKSGPPENSQHLGTTYYQNRRATGNETQLNECSWTSLNQKCSASLCPSLWCGFAITEDTHLMMFNHTLRIISENTFWYLEITEWIDECFSQRLDNIVDVVLVCAIMICELGWDDHGGGLTDQLLGYIWWRPRKSRMATNGSG